MEPIYRYYGFYILIFCQLFSNIRKAFEGLTEICGLGYIFFLLFIDTESFFQLKPESSKTFMLHKFYETLESGASTAAAP